MGYGPCCWKDPAGQAEMPERDTWILLPRDLIGMMPHSDGSIVSRGRSLGRAGYPESLYNPGPSQSSALGLAPLPSPVSLGPQTCPMLTLQAILPTHSLLDFMLLSQGHATFSMPIPEEGTFVLYSLLTGSLGVIVNTVGPVYYRTVAVALDPSSHILAIPSPAVTIPVASRHC